MGSRLGDEDAGGISPGFAAMAAAAMAAAATISYAEMVADCSDGRSSDCHNRE